MFVIALVLCAAGIFLLCGTFLNTDPLEHTWAPFAWGLALLLAGGLILLCHHYQRAASTPPTPSVKSGF